MRIAEVEISNILGTKHACFKPGTLTAVYARNGGGKSSLLDALKQVWAGGHDPSILRRGAKIGEAILTLDDGTVIRMRVSAKGTTYEITDAKGNEVKAPRAFIEQLGDCLSVDPARLLLAKPKELAGLLLEIMPLIFTQAELQEAVGEETWTVNQDMSLDQIEDLRRQIYDLRTAANRQSKDAEATARSLKSSLPECDPNVDWFGRAKELTALLDEAKQAREADIKAIDREEQEAVDDIKARAQKEIDRVHEVARQRRNEKDADFQPDLLKISMAKEEAEIRARDRDRAEGIRLSIERYEEQAKSAEQGARRMSAAIESLDQLKQSKLAQLPIAGLEVREGQVYMDGVPFERVNLAERIKVAFQIAAQRTGRLPFMVLDQAEAFDSDTWEAFKRGAHESGFQVLAARVSDGPLSIEVLDAEPLFVGA